MGDSRVELRMGLGAGGSLRIKGLFKSFFLISIVEKVRKITLNRAEETMKASFLVTALN